MGVDPCGDGLTLPNLVAGKNFFFWGEYTVVKGQGMGALLPVSGEAMMNMEVIP